MLGDAERQALPDGGLLPEADYVFTRPHVCGIPWMDLRGVIEEIVMVHGLRHEIFCPCFRIQVHQAVGIEVLGLPELYDVLVSEPGRVAVMADMVFILIRSFAIDVPRVPVAVHRDRLRSPVRPDAQFGIPEPFRAFKCPEGLKGRFERAFPYIMIHRGSSFPAGCLL